MGVRSPAPGAHRVVSPPRAVAPPTPAEVRAVLDEDPVGVTALAHSTRSGVTRGVWRVETPGRTAVVKCLSDGFADPDFRGSHDPTQPWYWRRELHLYERGAPGSYREAGLRAPERLGVTRRADGLVALWLEAAPGRNGAALSVADLGRVAERLGRAQGRYGVDESLPEESWWCRQFVGRYLRTFDADVDYGLLEDDRAWARPVIAEAVDGGLRARVGRLLADQDDLLGRLETRPRTVAHLDVWPANLFVSEDEVVLVDWAHCGLGAVGEDIGNLIVDAVLDLLLPAEALPEIEAVVVDGYRRGLDAAGWRGGVEDLLVALGGTAVKYLWLLPHMLGQAVAAERVGYGGRAVEDQASLFRARSEGLTRLMDWADRARDLAPGG